MKSESATTGITPFTVSILIVMEVENEGAGVEQIFDLIRVFQSLLLWKSKMKECISLES